MAKKKQGFFAWMLEYGIGGAYSVLLMFTVSITKWILIITLFALAWWERIR